MPKRSHITQAMQNYFDINDIRTRGNPTSLEVQLLNMAALEIEDLTLRMNRESSQTLQTVPVNIDNGGVYYGASVPSSLLTGPDQTSFNSVIGISGNVQTTLLPYVDTLPVPSRLVIDSANIVALTNPIMFSILGTGDPFTQVYTVQYVYPGVLPIPNKLTFWVDETGTNTFGVTLTIIGEVSPRPAWVAERVKTTETIQISGQGVAYTRNRWAQVDSIAIRGLPVGARLRAWSIPFNLPAAPDNARPYTTIQDRDILFNRYWQIDNQNSLLNEQFMAEGFTGLETINSFLLSDAMVDVAVEPNTNGLFVASDTVVYYIDRREVMADLSETGISAEPLFGLQVSLDITQTGPVRYAALSAVAYANASSILQYRYVINDQNCILPDGSLGPITGGWRTGVPQPVSVPMLFNGHYMFRLECQDVNGILTYDVVPFLNKGFSPFKSIDVSASIDNITGMAFDSYGQLWLWNGSYALPVIIHYDGYILDVDSQKIFTTEPFDSLQVS